MMAPKGGIIVNQKIYDAAFEFSVESNTDNTVTVGKFGKETKRMLVSDDSGEKDAKRFSFKPVVIEHVPRGIKIKIEFDDPK